MSEVEKEKSAKSEVKKDKFLYHTHNMDIISMIPQQRFVPNTVIFKPLQDFFHGNVFRKRCFIIEYYYVTYVWIELSLDISPVRQSPVRHKQVTCATEGSRYYLIDRSLGWIPSMVEARTGGTQDQDTRPARPPQWYKTARSKILVHFLCRQTGNLLEHFLQCHSD